MNNKYELSRMVEMEKRQKIAKDFYDRVLDLDEHPLIVTDEASFYDIYIGDDLEAIDIIYKEYGVTLSREKFQMPFWKMLDILYTSNQQRVNPFKGLSFSQIAEKLKAKGYNTKGRDPLNRAGAFFHPRTDRKYYLDHGGQYKKSYEHAHVDVHYTNVQVGTKLEKRKYPLGNKLYEKNKKGID